MILPTVSTNGTSAAELLTGWDAVARGLYAALKALGDAPINPRDYGPQWPDAKAEHERRLAAVAAVLDDVAEITASLEDAS